MIKPRAMANFPLSQPILFHCVPFPGCRSHKAGAGPAGPGVAPGLAQGQKPLLKWDTRDRLTQFSCGRLELALGGCHPGRLENDALAGKSPSSPSVSRGGPASPHSGRLEQAPFGPCARPSDTHPQIPEPGNSFPYCQWICTS